MKPVHIFLVIYFLLISYGLTEKHIQWDDGSHTLNGIFTYEAGKQILQNGIGGIREFALDFHERYKLFTAFFITPPLHRILQAVSFTIFGISLYTALLPTIALSLIALYLLHGLLRRLGRSEEASLSSIILLSLTPYYFMASRTTSQDLPGLALLLLSLYYFYQNRPWNTGLALALASIMRYPTMAAYPAYTYLYYRRKRLLQIVKVGLILLPFIVPWIILQQYASPENLDRIIALTPASGQIGDYLTAQSMLWADIIEKIELPILILAIIGLRRKDVEPLSFFTIILLLTFIVIRPDVLLPRYILPAIIPILAIGLSNTLERVERKKLAVLIAALLIIMVPVTFKDYYPQEPDRLKVIKYLEEGGAKKVAYFNAPRYSLLSYLHNVNISTYFLTRSFTPLQTEKLLTKKFYTPEYEKYGFESCPDYIVYEQRLTCSVGCCIKSICNYELRSYIETTPLLEKIAEIEGVWIYKNHGCE